MDFISFFFCIFHIIGDSFVSNNFVSVSGLNQERTALEQRLCDLCSKKKDLMSYLNSITQFIKNSDHVRNIDVCLFLPFLLYFVSLVAIKIFWRVSWHEHVGGQCNFANLQIIFPTIFIKLSTYLHTYKLA